MQNGWIATKLAHDGPQYRPHRGCVCWRSRSKSKVTWYGHFSDVTKCLLYSTFRRSVSTCTHFFTKHHYTLLLVCQAARCNVTPAFALRKFFKESLTHGPLNLCVNEKTVRVNDSPYFQFRSHTVPPPIPMPILKCWTMPTSYKIYVYYVWSNVGYV